MQVYFFTREDKVERDSLSFTDRTEAMNRLLELKHDPAYADWRQSKGARSFVVRSAPPIKLKAWQRDQETE